MIEVTNAEPMWDLKLGLQLHPDRGDDWYGFRPDAPRDD